MSISNAKWPKQTEIDYFNLYFSRQQNTVKKHLIQHRVWWCIYSLVTIFSGLKLKCFSESAFNYGSRNCHIPSKLHFFWNYCQVNSSQLFFFRIIILLVPDKMKHWHSKECFTVWMCTREKADIKLNSFSCEQLPVLRSESKNLQVTVMNQVWWDRPVIRRNNSKHS